MGWLSEAGDHEGWVADILTDGRMASGSTLGGVIVTELTDADIAGGREIRRFEGTDYVNVIVPWSEVTTWRTTCSCGWTGTTLPAIDGDPEYGPTRDCPEDVVELQMLPSWREHVAPFEALSGLEEVMREIRGLERDAVNKVRLSRSVGASWTDIGRAAGMSKQGAQQRWANA